MIDSLYVHIPFCVQKCLYCDFNSYTCIDQQEDYLKALEKELSSIEQRNFKTIFVGGGTPSILAPKNLLALLQMLRSFHADEYTFESNPGTLTFEKLHMMKAHGVNRLSLGLQTSNDQLLKKLGRIHNYSDFLTSFETARSAGFKNINIDLMFGIPDQTLEAFKTTLDMVLQLNPEHISCYSLIIEEGTPFYELEADGKLELCDEDTERNMYYYAIEKLKANNYTHYEISNFSKPGLECRHNITYWKDEQYYGVGAGAHSYIDSIRYSNFMGVSDYIKNVNLGSAIEFSNKVTLADELSEYMFLGLRRIKGISKEAFKTRFTKDIYDVYFKELNELINKNLLLDDGVNIKLTPRGIDISNQVFVNFIK